MKPLDFTINKITNKEELFVYLAGVWLGDGCKTSTQLMISGLKEYLDILFSKVIKKIQPTAKFTRYTSGQVGCFINCSDILVKIRKELDTPRLIYKHPMAFLAGFLDTDGCILEDKSSCKVQYQYKLEFYNTNRYYLSLVETILNQYHISYRLNVKKVQQLNNYSKRKIKAAKDEYTITINQRPELFYLCYLLKNYVLRKLPQNKLQKCMNSYYNFYIDKTLPITERFTSINGEGLSIGIPQHFIRVYGCNLQCPGCDTSYSWRKSKTCKVQDTSTKFISTSISDLLNGFELSKVDWVCLTGGEFTLYTHRLKALVSFLKCMGAHITLQTNGTKYLDIFNLIDIVACDIKSPCTGVQSNLSIIKKLKSKDEVKTLISDNIDFDFAIKINKLVQRSGCTHVLQPWDVTNTQDEKIRKDNYLKKYSWLSQKVLASSLKNTRVLLQIHKLVWGFNRKGI
jgi:7-carboxy-7-deazaguanine synthase